jgi:hypothetical protein
MTPRTRSRKTSIINYNNTYCTNINISKYRIYTMCWKSLEMTVSPSATICYVEILVSFFVYSAMSMVVIGPLLLYEDKVGGVCCMMFIDSYWWWYADVLEQVQRDRNTWTQVQDQNCSFQLIKQRIGEKWNQTTKWMNSQTKNKINEWQQWINGYDK